MIALKEGTFSRPSKKYTAAEIAALRESKGWKKRFDPFLRKEILPGTTIEMNLERWIGQYKNATDDAGRSLFTRRTEKIAVEQIKKVKYVSDPPTQNMYKRIPPGPRSSHNLPKWKSTRPESNLEKFHERLAHLANTGCKPKLADAITLRGTAEYNVSCRWREFVNRRKLDGKKIDVPCHFEDIPRHRDHSLLDLLNCQAKCLDLPPPFENVTAIGEDNGEVFLSSYYIEQKKRNEEVGQDEKTGMCKCPECAFISGGERASTDDKSENIESETTGRDNENSTEEQLVLPATPTQAPLVPLQIAPPLPFQTFNYPYGSMHQGWLLHSVNLNLAGPITHAVPHCCRANASYQHRKSVGEIVLGRPPHGADCPMRKK